MNLDEDLRRLGRDDIWNDEPFELRPAAPISPSRSSRGWLLLPIAAAVIAAAAAGTLLISGRPAGHPAALPTPAATLVPWTDSKPSTAIVAAGSASASHYPACTAADVTVTNTSGGKAMGAFEMPTFIRNTSHGPCSLTDRDLTLLTKHDGRTQPIATTRVDPQQATLIVLAPGATTHFQAAITGNCRAGQGLLGPWTQPLWLEVHGTPIRLHGALLPTDARLTCAGINDNAGSSSYYRDDPEPNPTGPYTHVRAAITAPHTVTAGEQLRYTVTLTNTARTTLSFTDCPTYEQYVTADNGHGGQANTRTINTLNCAAAHPLKHGASITFEMLVTVPVNAAPGYLKLGWAIGDQVFAGDVLTVQKR
ncbi:DUF4232 domain-containing protein [Amnibacterium sp. CER49]|uniref:DUF4232 domain-containing protein n=1 Tax=Amnibacterium sp. CER49 TaxID=3039161 RepID=UPI002448C6A9|nr:DUF4232 domain-containing protein [Amnibacterium sp. CER49]MDH2445113.1 DUF4232 domain-containing protein [Amnibacterium sp. CER49]